MTRSVLALLSALVLASPVAAQTSPPNQSPPDQLKIGIAHFERAFYELTPQKRHAEAAVEFDAAVAALERALADNPRSAQAHTCLARIHAARKNFKQAAAHWDQVAAIEPFNVDACVLASLALIDAGDVDEARLRLLEGRLRTRDPAVLARLDEYLAKLDALKR
jgi:lipopolysaccharide biosynthesis regulator YciM